MNKEQEEKEKEHLRQSILSNVLCLHEKIHYDKFGHDTKGTQILSQEKALEMLERFKIEGCAAHCGSSVRERIKNGIAYIIFTESDIKPSTEKIFAAYDGKDEKK